MTGAPNEVVIVEAVRSPIGRRGGGLSTMHSADLLAAVQRELIDRSGIDPTEVGQVIGGCVSQVGQQAGQALAGFAQQSIAAAGTFEEAVNGLAAVTGSPSSPSARNAPTAISWKPFSAAPPRL